MRVLSGFFILIFCALPAAAGAGLETAAGEVAALIAEKPAGVAEPFDKSLFRHISLEKLSEVLAGIYKENGAVLQTVFASSSAGSGHFFLDTERGYRIPLAISLDAGSGKINGIFFSPAYKKDTSLKDVRERLAALPGRTGLLVRRLGEKPENLEALNEDAYFAVGSAFKLYVLGTLIKEGLSWEKVFRLKAKDKSLPTGRLRDWPDGSPFTVHTLAALMISESDNTASDALISALGRRTIEADLAALGHSDPERLKPFLKTSELFKLRADTEASLEYMNLPAAEKYDFLSSLEKVPLDLDKVKRSPFGVDKIEWFASPADLCRLMGYFTGKEAGKAREILALNPGLDIPREKLVYAGYKGGSEPGVLSMTWLLKNKRSEWLCLSASWNNEKDGLAESEFFGLLQSALNALGESGGQEAQKK
ncbi:MAG: serine hydrolase [Elusimicrobiales bacterium]|nr:serine hydrolase [Elusimicrobiales bacterium]